MRILIAVLAVAFTIVACKEGSSKSRPYGPDPIERSGDIEIASD